MRTITLDDAPRLPALLTRAALTARGRGGPLPSTQVVRSGVRVDRAALAAYDRVCGLPLRNTVPATYLHVLTFGLQMTLMSEREFPLALPGLVHLSNQLILHRPVDAGEPLDLTVHAEGLRPHAKGTQVDLVATARSGSEPVWAGRSTYLARDVRPPGATRTAVAAPDLESSADPVGESDPALGPPQAIWRLPADAGRRYAAVSGDVNPIHLNPLAAKAFGFPRAIAHGMWTAARCLAFLEPRLPAAYQAQVGFRRPVLLPSRVQLRTTRDDDGWQFTLTGAGDGREHLRGRAGIA